LRFLRIIGTSLPACFVGSLAVPEQSATKEDARVSRRRFCAKRCLATQKAKSFVAPNGAKTTTAKDRLHVRKKTRGTSRRGPGGAPFSSVFDDAPRAEARRPYIFFFFLVFFAGFLVAAFFLGAAFFFLATLRVLLTSLLQRAIVSVSSWGRHETDERAA
jgi:hypothetical protein